MVYILKDVVIGLKNIKKNYDSVFDEIESYVRHWGKKKEGYFIGMMDICYAEKGKKKRLVQRRGSDDKRRDD